MALPQRVRVADQLIRRIEWDDLDRAAIRRLVETAWTETPRAFGMEKHRAADLVASAGTVVCGSALLPVIAAAYGLQDGSRARLTDGTLAPAGTVVAVLSGPCNLLHPVAEVALAFIRRLSGVAAHARAHVEALGTGRTRLLDRGTFTPGWRILEKFALGRGGAWDSGSNSERTRIEICGDAPSTDLEATVRRARDSAPDSAVELLVRNPAVVATAAAASADVIRLENFSIPEIKSAVACVNGRAFVEAHGGITLSNIAAHAGLGLDFVSVDGLVSDASWAPVAVCWRD